LRAALSGTPSTVKAAAESAPSVAGFRPVEAREGLVVTNEQIDQLRDEAGL